MAHRLAEPARPTAAVLVASAGLLVLSCGETPPPVPTTFNLAVVNARIWTGDPGTPWAEALAVADGRIVATGASDAIQLLAPEANIVDARRRLVLPGFIDSYTQVLDLDAVPGRLPLGGVRSRRQLVTSVRTATATRAADDWIRGHDWDQRLWGGTLPDRTWIDPVTPDHPVWLQHRDGQAGLANSVALSRARIVAGLTGADRGPDGTLTGILSGPAMRQLEARLPTLSTAGVDRALDSALAEAATRGITSAYHVGDWDDLDLFLRARSEGRLTVRIYAAVPLGEWLRLDRAIAVGTFGGTDGRGDDRFRVGLVHASLDGTLASASAAFDAPYQDSMGGNAAGSSDLKTMWPLALSADAAGLQIVVGAVGDRANRTALDLAEHLLAREGPRDRRFRVAHAQHLHPPDIARFATQRALASLLPFSALHDGRWIDQQLGPQRGRTSFAVLGLLDAGAHVSFGSGRLNRGSPIDGIYAAVTRRTLDGLHPQGWRPEQRVTVEQALRAYTTGAAYAGFDETRVGALDVGHLADFVMVDRDLLTVAPTDIPTVRVVLTVVGGEIVLDRRRRTGS